MWWHFLEVQNMLFEDMVFMKKIVTLSRKGTFFFFFFPYFLSLHMTPSLFHPVFLHLQLSLQSQNPPHSPLPSAQKILPKHGVAGESHCSESWAQNLSKGIWGQELSTDPNITQHSCFCRQPLPLGQIKSDVTECRELFKANISSAVWRGRYYSVLIKPDLHCGGLSFGSKILLSQGCKYARW